MTISKSQRGIKRCHNVYATLATFVNLVALNQGHIFVHIHINAACTNHLLLFQMHPKQ